MRFEKGAGIRVLQGKYTRPAVFLEEKGEMVKVFMDREQWVHRTVVYPFN